MKPRGFWSTFIITTIKTVVIVGLPLSLLGTVITDYTFAQLIMVTSIAFTLFSFVAAFEHRGVTMSWTFQNRETFLGRLNTELNKLDFHRQSQTEATLTYKHGLWPWGPKIYVQIEQSSVAIVGRSCEVTALRIQMVDLSKDTPDSA